MVRAILRILLVLLLLLPFSSFIALPAAAFGPGDLDTTFDTNGKVTTNFGGGVDVGYAVAIQSDGKIVVAGYSNAGGTQDFALARYNANGSLDTTNFGTLGKVTTDFPGGNDFGQSVAIQSDGKIVVAGFSNASGTQDFALARYNANGGLDTSFGTAGTGRVLTDFPGGSDFGQSVAIQSDGKIVVAGYSNASGTYDFALARYHGLSATGIPGTLDTSFGTLGTGRVLTDFAGVDHGNSVAIQSDGKIVVAGAANIGGAYDFALARYNTDGTLDTATPFGTLGKVTTDFGAGDGGWSVAIQSDGKIVVAGGSGSGGAGSVAVARYHGLSATGAPGTLDTTTFGTLGKVTTGFTGGYGNSVAIQSDGKIVVVGSVVAGFGDFTLVRYTTSGTLDTTFDTDGKVTTDFGGPTDNSTGVAIQSDGKIVVSGLADTGTAGPYDFAVARYWAAAPTPTPTPTPVPGVGWHGLLVLASVLAVLGFLASTRKARARRAG